MGKRVLIVDDAPFIREVVSEMAEKIGYRVVGEVGDGQAAVDFIKANEVDIVVMDIALPIKNGLQATKEILSINPELKIIACSTIENEPIVQQALAAGCRDFIFKPFKMNHLRMVFQKVASGY